MRSIILNVAVSLDGLIEGPKGEYDWCLTDQDYGMKAFLDRIDAVFYGRKSYEMMMKVDGTNPFANKKSFVFSNTMAPGSDYELVAGDIKSKVTAIKQSKGRDIWLFGGASLTASLMKEQLVDELMLAVHPIVLGRGKGLFEMMDNRQALKLLETKSYSSGLVGIHYAIEKNK